MGIDDTRDVPDCLAFDCKFLREFAHQFTLMMHLNLKPQNIELWVFRQADQLLANSVTSKTTVGISWRNASYSAVWETM